MADYVTFDGQITPLEWGKSTYTILRLPPDVVLSLGATKRVEGEINDHPVNLALTRAPVCPDVFLWAGQSLLDRIGIAPGEAVEVRLRPAPNTLVDVPDDITLALRQGDATVEWEALTPGKQRGLLYQISTAKTEATRAKRILSMIAALKAPP
jgi:Bacteriocin-protection, YdeI or OmpD-Associated/Domain of unknown function (DUF1905)